MAHFFKKNRQTTPVPLCLSLKVVLLLFRKESINDSQFIVSCFVQPKSFGCEHCETKARTTIQ